MRDSFSAGSAGLTWRIDETNRALRTLAANAQAKRWLTFTWLPGIHLIFSRYSPGLSPLGFFGRLLRFK